jgi:predicted RNase H-like HicB family nuclease
MNTLRFTYWQDGDAWLGYLEEFPDYWTQGYSVTELKVNLLDLYRDLEGGHVAGIRR